MGKEINWVMSQRITGAVNHSGSQRETFKLGDWREFLKRQFTKVWERLDKEESYGAVAPWLKVAPFLSIA